ncbi:DUF3649 domain-containing protein [Cupriavidus sp. AU9028]|uniref:DUF3649 domain-containing protein n=1 Tax=Cupriavidus sp. AU9028 TaxID=2871157 RepID=UPI001C96F059|nr:DUF3649 domain-containing protein [Cupriavidus sp. AU9028]MBY4899215.1 DUF3649 domain-containing protein [Cupriavidus sp. AU9028]
MLRPWLYRLGVASRAVAGIAGGYGLAALATAWLAVALPGPRAEAVTAATLLSFAIYAGAVMWVFAARTAWRAWAGLAMPALALAVALWAQRGAAAGG